MFSAAMSKAHSAALIAAFEPQRSFVALPMTEKHRRATCLAKFTQRLLREELHGMRCHCCCPADAECTCADNGLTKALVRSLQTSTVLSSLAALASCSAVGMRTVLSILTNLSALGGELQAVLAAEASVRETVLSGLLHDPLESAAFVLPCVHGLRHEPAMQRALCANAAALTARFHSLAEAAHMSEGQEDGENIVRDLLQSMRESTTRRLGTMRVLREETASHHNKARSRDEVRKGKQQVAI